MPLMDEFREEREALKNGTFKEKLQYFMDYYKWYAIGGVIAVICVISIARSILTSRDAALHVPMLNCIPLTADDESFQQDFAEFAGIDLKENELFFDTDCSINLSSNDQSTANTIQKLMVSMAAKDLDAMMGGGDAFAYYANSGVFSDLREILSEEQFQACQSGFYYVDMAVVNEIERRNYELEDTSTINIPDPKKPEEMQYPVPVAIYIDSSKLENYYYFPDTEDGLAFGVFTDARQLKNALAFIDYLLQL